MSTTRIPLYYGYADEVRQLERTPSNHFRLLGRGISITVPAACIDLQILRKSQPSDTPFFGVIHVQLMGLNLAVHCDEASIHAAHQAFPGLAFKTEEAEVAHEL